MEKNHEEQLELAVAAHVEGNEDVAERMYKRILEETRVPKALSYLAEIYMNREEYGDAEDLLDEALELEESDSAIWLNLGNLHYLQENKNEAIEAFSQASKLDPKDDIAKYQLAVLQGKTSDAQKYQQGYAESLFDDYAPHFESALVDDLNYATPDNFTQILKENFSKNWHFDSVLDVGCGTGLVAEKIADHVDEIVGVDLSEGMLDVAEEKDVYSELHHADVVQYMKDNKAQFQLILAADVLVYLGDLKEFMKFSYKRLEEGGCLLLSVEDGEMGMFESYKVQPSGRFCHKESYVKKLAEKVGFEEMDYQFMRLRDEEGSPLMGHHILLRKII